MPDPFSQLLEWRRAEANARTLSKIGPELYSSTARYLADLRRSYEADLRENPSGRRGEISRQTYQRASQVARDIVESRVQKLLALAFQASIGGPRDAPNALPEERAVFERILASLFEYRHATAPYLEPAGSAAPTTAPSPPVQRPADRPAAPAASAPAPAPSGSQAAPTLSYVRIVKDSKPVEVGPETIELRSGDLVSVPPSVAKLLIEARVAEPVRATPPPR